LRRADGRAAPPLEVDRVERWGHDQFERFSKPEQTRNEMKEALRNFDFS